MTKKERQGNTRVFYQVVWADQRMTILGCLAGPFRTLQEAREAKKEQEGSGFRGGPMIRKVTFDIVS